MYLENQVTLFRFRFRFRFSNKNIGVYFAKVENKGEEVSDF